MVKASTGLKRGTRRRLKREVRDKFTVERLMKEFKPQERVIIKGSPATQKGFPPPRYRGFVGIVMSRRGAHYVVEIQDGKKKKTIITGPENLVQRK